MPPAEAVWLSVAKGILMAIPKDPETKFFDLKLADSKMQGSHVGNHWLPRVMLPAIRSQKLPGLQMIHIYVK